jgi:CBS domain-containing protein/uncharacterized protein (DUF2267 family)
MASSRSPGIIKKIKVFTQSFGRKLPTFPSAELIDREYIEDETPEEIGEISQMTDIPDKSERHPHRLSRTRGGKKVAQSPRESRLFLPTKSIQPFIQKKVVVLHHDATIEQAARAMQEHQIGCVLVSDHAGHIVGIATDRDLVTGVLTVTDKTADQMKIAAVMTRDPVFVDENTDLKQVIRLMEEHEVRRIPVIHQMSSGTDMCIGLVTLDDLIASKSIDLKTLNRIVRSQLKRSRWPVESPSHLPTSHRQERDHFYERVASKMIPKLEFTRDELEQLSGLILGVLVQRLHHTGAVQLIGQLPSSLQPALLNLPSGPDETMTSDRLMRDVRHLFNIDDPTAYAVLIRFCAGLEEWCDSKVLNHIKAQLPKDLNSFFSTTEVEAKKKKSIA